MTVGVRALGHRIGLNWRLLGWTVLGAIGVVASWLIGEMARLAGWLAFQQPSILPDVVRVTLAGAATGAIILLMAVGALLGGWAVARWLRSLIIIEEAA